MHSPFMQLLQLFSWIMGIGILLIVGLALFRYNEYVDYNRSAQEIIRTTDVVPSNTSYYDNNNVFHAKVVDQQNYVKPSDRADWDAQKLNSYNANRASYLLAKLNREYDYMFTIRPESHNSPKQYGQQMLYHTQVNIPMHEASMGTNGISFDGFHGSYPQITTCDVQRSTASMNKNQFNGFYQHHQD